MKFEKGICLLGGYTDLFPPKAPDKKEDIKDVMGYLNNWADAMVVRRFTEEKRHLRMSLTVRILSDMSLT